MQADATYFFCDKKKLLILFNRLTNWIFVMWKNLKTCHESGKHEDAPP